MTKQDLLWKGAIKDFFPAFLTFFFPKKSQTIDFSRGFTFLDKELDKIRPSASTKNRRADMLVKVVLKTGKIQYLLIHIEVQGYVDEDFDFRMFVYYYRIFDQLKLPIKAMAIYVDDSPTYHPKSFIVKDDGWGTELTYKFKTYKLYDQKIEELEKSTNPFGIILATAWHGLYKNCPKTDEDLLKLKIQLFKNLRAKGYSKLEIIKLMDFIKHYVHFDKRTFYSKFDSEIQKITKTQESMGIQEAIIYSAKLEGMEKGVQKGIDLSIKKVLKKGHSVKAVANMFDVSVEYVEALKKKLRKS